MQEENGEKNVKGGHVGRRAFQVRVSKERNSIGNLFFEEKDDQGMNEKWNDKRIERKPRGDEIEEIESV